MESLCERMEQLIIDYALDELEESEKHIVEEHVQACSECSRALEETRDVIGSVSEHEMLEPSEALCESVKRSVREQFRSRPTVFSVIGDMVSSFARRPVFAGVSALVAITAMFFLFVLPGLRDSGDAGDPNVGYGRGGEAIKPLEVYFSECDRILDMISQPGAVEALAVQGREQWVHLIGQAMDLREQPGLRRYDALLSDLESLYRIIESRRGRFTSQDLDEIRTLVSQKRLAERVSRVLKAWK